MSFLWWHLGGHATDNLYAWLFPNSINLLLVSFTIYQIDYQTNEALFFGWFSRPTLVNFLGIHKHYQHGKEAVYLNNKFYTLGFSSWLFEACASGILIVFSLCCCCSDWVVRWALCLSYYCWKQAWRFDCWGLGGVDGSGARRYYHVVFPYCLSRCSIECFCLTWCFITSCRVPGKH